MNLPTPTPMGPPEMSGIPGYEVRLDLRRSSMDHLTAVLFRAIVENWCGRNCHHNWLIEDDDAHISLFFDNSRDLFVFQLTEEFDIFNRHSPLS